MALFCGNIELCRITEDLVFTDPWRVAEANRWTSPQLDLTAAAVRADGPWKRAAQELKLSSSARRGADPRRPAFRLDHGDRDPRPTPSIRSSPSTARWASTSAPFRQSLPRLFAQGGHEAKPATRDGYRDWILATAEQVWTRSTAASGALWNGRHASETFAPGLFADGAGPAALRTPGCLYAPPVRRCAGLRRVQDDRRSWVWPMSRIWKASPIPTCAPNARSGR